MVLVFAFLHEPAKNTAETEVFMSKRDKQNEAASEVDVLLKDYRTRIAKENWIKALLCGLTTGFCLDLVLALVFLFFGVRLFWICIIAFVAGTAVATPLFYFKKFKSSTRQVASRVDTLGLEERILTMAQFENDDSYMARRQREDAVSALKTVNESLIKFAVSVPLIVICATACVLGAGATTASALSNKAIVDRINENLNPPTAYTVNYAVNGQGGTVLGPTSQTVNHGENAAPVEAVAEDGFVFVGWSDGLSDAYREDADLKGNLTVSAVFLPIEDSEEEETGDDQDSESDKSEKGDKFDPSKKDPNAPPSDDPSDDSDGSDGDSDGQGGKSKPNNQIIDGNTYYGDEYDNSMSDAQDSMNAGADMSGNQKDTIGNYFHNIAK